MSIVKINPYILNNSLSGYSSQKVKPYILIKNPEYKLPDEVSDLYEQVEYLESTGEQYINTGIVDITTLVASMDAEFTQLTNSYQFMGQEEFRGRHFGIDSTGNFTLEGGITSNLNPLQKRSLVHNIFNGGNSLSIDGTVITRDGQSPAGNEAYCLFGCRTGETNCYCKIYFCKMSINNNAVRDFIPCYRKADNKPGLYDTVNDVFYVNANAGASRDFIIGNTVTKYILQKVKINILTLGLPSEYQEVEYLESRGAQWIDTSCPMNTIQKIVYEYKNTGDIGLAINALYGRYSNNNTTIQCRITSSDCGYKWAQNNYSYAVDSDIHSIEMSSTYFKKDGTLIAQYTSETITDTDGLVLFARRKDDSGVAIYNYGYFAIYYFQIYNNNGSLVRNFIPCYRKADNKPGLYDLINDVFYTNANSGTSQDFIVGPNIN